MAKSKKRSKVGRPRKFEGPTQNFYITLPSGIVQQLKAVDEHLATAIVKLCTGSQFSESSLDPEVGLLPVVISPERWAISICDPSLADITPLALIPHTPGRWLLAFDPELDPRDLELQLRDCVETNPPQSALIQRIIEQLSLGRRQERATTVQLLLYSQCEEVFEDD